MGRDAPQGPDCNLTDLLQQLNNVLATKPSERPLVRQGQSKTLCNLYDIHKLATVIIKYKKKRQAL